MLYAKTKRSAEKWARDQVKLQQKEFNEGGFDCDDKREIAHFSFGDGQTLVSLKDIKEVPEAFALDCHKYGVCYIVNPKE